MPRLAIRRAGVMEDGRARLDLKAENGAFDWTWFVSKPSVGREVLAIAIVAISTDRRISCVIQDPVASFSEMSNFFLLK
jgi:hypothetical protein